MYSQYTYSDCELTEDKIKNFQLKINSLKSDFRRANIQRQWAKREEV